MTETGYKIQFLFIGSSPSAQAVLELPKEYNDIARLLPRERFAVESRWSEPATNLPDLLQEYRPRSRTGALLFEDEHGTLEADPDAVAEVFAQAQPRVHCVVLNACYSGVEDIQTVVW